MKLKSTLEKAENKVELGELVAKSSVEKKIQTSLIIYNWYSAGLITGISSDKKMNE